LIGARVAIVQTIDPNDQASHRYGVLRGIVPIDKYHVTYLIQLDDPEGFVGLGNGRPLHRILEIGSFDESCYVMLDPRHPGTGACRSISTEGQRLAGILGAIGESLSSEQLERIKAELTIEQQMLFMEVIEVAMKLRNQP
jgi:hypothetical protein